MIDQTIPWNPLVLIPQHLQLHHDHHESDQRSGNRSPPTESRPVNQTGDASGGLYGAGRYGYSVNYASSSRTVTGVTSSLTADAYNFNTVFSQSYAGQFGGGHLGAATNATAVVHSVLVDLASVSASNGGVGALDRDTVKSWNLRHGTAAVVKHLFREFTQLTNASGAEVAADAATHVRFVVSGSGSTVANSKLYQVEFQVAPTETARGDYEDGVQGRPNPTDNLAIPEINLEMKSIAIVAKTRKLKAVWTPEFAQDLNAYHSIDAEAELTSMLSEYISQEIDLEILDMLMNNALV